MSTSSTRHRRLHPRAALLSLALMFSLLFTQWLGYAHLIAHADGIAEAARVDTAKNGFGEHQKTAGTCAAFDAAALGAGLHTPDITPTASPVASFAPSSACSEGCSPAFFVHFSSRAPPLTA